MYTYYKGLVIREGTTGVKPELLMKLYQDAGWIGKEFPKWQIEKFAISMENSTWAFTVWDKEDIVGMVRVLSDKVMFANVHDLIVLSTHKGKGIGRELLRLCMQKLPHGTWHAYTTTNNYEFYKKCGLDIKDTSESGCSIYCGYFIARQEGHR